MLNYLFFHLISYRNIPIIEETKTKASLSIPPNEKLKILYAITNGDEINIVERTITGFVKEKVNVFKTMAIVINKEVGLSYVIIPTIKKITTNT